jgi:hypothetical protein
MSAVAIQMMVPQSCWSLAQVTVMTVQREGGRLPRSLCSGFYFIMVTSTAVHLAVARLERQKSGPKFGLGWFEVSI